MIDPDSLDALQIWIGNSGGIREIEAVVPDRQLVHYREVMLVKMRPDGSGFRAATVRTRSGLKTCSGRTFASWAHCRIRDLRKDAA